MLAVVRRAVPAASRAGEDPAEERARRGGRVSRGRVSQGRVLRVRVWQHVNGHQYWSVERRWSSGKAIDYRWRKLGESLDICRLCRKTGQIETHSIRR